MDRRRFLLLGSAATAAIASGTVPRELLARSAEAGLRIAFAGPGGGELVEATRAGGGERLAGPVEAVLRLGAVARPLEIEVDCGAGVCFQGASVRCEGGRVACSQPRRFEIHGGVATLYVDGSPLRFGAGGLPLRRGSYVVWLGEAARGARLVEGRLIDAAGEPIAVPHVVLELERLGLA